MIVNTCFIEPLQNLLCHNKKKALTHWYGDALGHSIISIYARLVILFCFLALGFGIPAWWGVCFHWSPIREQWGVLCGHMMAECAMKWKGLPPSDWADSIHWCFGSTPMWYLKYIFIKIFCCCIAWVPCGGRTGNTAVDGKRVWGCGYCDRFEAFFVRKETVNGTNGSVFWYG